VGLGWVVAAAVVAIVAGLTILSAGGSGGSGVTDPTRFDLPALGREGRVRLADFRGKPVVANFFASWCTACRFELPGFAAAADKLRGKVVFVGVNSQETGNGLGMAREFELEENGFVLAKDVGGRQRSGLHDKLGGRGMPITAFYDARGRLLHVAGGALPEDALRQALRQLYGVDV
jgi:cytochrome c biogenesis protein CcmG/thiol:disulfide interchange protein DsbE